MTGLEPVGLQRAADSLGFGAAPVEEWAVEAVVVVVVAVEVGIACSEHRLEYWPSQLV